MIRWDERFGRGLLPAWIAWLLLGLLVNGQPRAAGTVLTFEPYERLTNAPPGRLSEGYGDRVAGEGSDGFEYGSEAGATPEISVRFSTARLETDQINQAATFGLQPLRGAWNHGPAQTALFAKQGDGLAAQMIRLQLRGTDLRHPVLHALDLVGGNGRAAVLPRLVIGDGQLTTLYVTSNVAVPASGALTLRFDPPLSARDVHVWVDLGRTPPLVGLDNVVFGEAPVEPSVWVAETVFQAPPLGPDRPFVTAASLHFDGARRPVAAWTEATGNATAWWGRREAEGWRQWSVTQFAAAPVLSLSAGKGFATLAMASNGVPHLYHMLVRYFENQPPYYSLARANLASSPQGPALDQGQVPVAASLEATFEADGRASNPPDYVTLHDRGSLRWNGVSDLTAAPVSLGNAARVRFRQGPERQIHVVYQTSDGTLHYNAGAADRDRAVLPGNTGSSAYSLAVDDANGVHIAAAAGTGRFFFGAVGQLTYLHSADGRTWSTNTFTSVPADVGSTAIAVDRAGRPAIAFTRAFQSLYFTRFDGRGWTPPTLLRESLGGWDQSREIQLAFDASDRPHVLVPDALTRRLLLLSPEPESVPADLGILAITASSPRVAVGSNITLFVTVTNGGPRNATAAQVRLRLAPELVVRDATPRPSERHDSTVEYGLGTLQAYESRTLQLVVTASDPATAWVEASIGSETPDRDVSNDSRREAPTEFVPGPCVANPGAPGCAGFDLLPVVPPPALAREPWSLPLRIPRAPWGSEVRVGGATPLPPGFCLTADGELRGILEGPGILALDLEVVEPGGRVTRHPREVQVVAGMPLPQPAAFWSLDGHAVDSVGGVSAVLGARGTWIGGAVGSALQASWDALNDARNDLARPDPLFAAPPLFTNAVWGRGPVTVTAWMRRDDGASMRGDARRYGYVLGLFDPDDLFESRSVAFDPASGRLNLLSGVPDFRATVLPGPMLSGRTWHHVALVNEGTRVWLYTNGVLAVSGQFARGLPDRPVLWAGGDSFGGTYSGALDEIAIYREALDASAVAGLVRNAPPRRRPLPEGGGFPIAAMVRELVLPMAAQGERYEAQLAPAFCGVPVSIRRVQGELPTGLELNAVGVLRGTSSVAGTARFRVRATDAAGAWAELEVVLTTKPGVPVFTREPGDQQVDAAGVLFLLAETRSEESYQWYFNDRPLAGETKPVLVVENFSAGQSGRYRLLASNAAGATWSREVRVGLRLEPEKPATLEVAPVLLRPDGGVRVRVATLRGRVYELQRALDLGAALSGGWRTVKRFLAEDTVGEVEDLLPGRPGAAFYRLVEFIPTAASPFSLEDPARFVGVATDGKARPGLLPTADVGTGRLGPMEYRVAGQALGEGEGLVLRLPGGAQPVDRDGQTVLRFRQGELAFGEESPVQLDEGGSDRVRWNAPADLELPAGPLSVATLERLLGKPAGSGIGLTFFRHFHFTLLSGVFEGSRIREARLRWADAAAGRLPTPPQMSEGLALDLELSATRLRLPFHGEFSLADGTRSAARVSVSPNQPVWIELRPGPELALSGRGQVAFEGGPEFTVEFTLDDPVFRGAISAKSLRLPEGLTLREFLGRVPRPVLPLPPPSPSLSRGGLAPASPGADSYLASLKGAARLAALRSCAGSATARQLLGEVAAQPDLVEAPEVAADEDDSDETRSHFTEQSLAELRAWGCVAEAAGGWDRVPDPEYFRGLIERHVLVARADTLPTGQGAGELGAMTFAYRVAVLAEVAHVATLYPPEMADPAYLHLAVTDPRFTASLNPPNPRLQPSVDWAFESVEELRGVDATTYDSTTLAVAARALAKVIAAANRNTTVIPPARAEAVQRQFEELLRARVTVLERELGIERGRFSPEGNAKVEGLKRYEALAALRKALRLHDTLQRSGADMGTALAPELFSQLASRAWLDLKSQIVAITNQCTAPAYYRVLGASAEISAIGRVGDLLGLAGVATELPTSEDITRYTSAMQSACLAARPPVRLEDLYLQVDPSRVNEGRVLAVEGRMFWLAKLPAAQRTATPEILEALQQGKEAFDPLFAPAALPLIESFRAGLLLRTLRVGMMQDNLRRRFRLPADADWLNTQLPALSRVMKRRLRGANLETANRLLYLAAWRPRANPTRGATGASPGLMTVGAGGPAASENHDDAPEDLERRYAYLQAALEGVEVEEQGALALGDEAGVDAPTRRGLASLADVRLPGGLTVEEASGELTFHTGRRELSGHVRGQVQVPGAGLRLTLNHAQFSSGGAFSGEIHGSLAVPADQPVATLSVPAEQPARLSLARGQVPTLSGGGRLQLSNGATLDVFLSLADPVYRFSASARGLRFQFTRATFEQIGVPLSDALVPAVTGRALEYLTRAGLLGEGALPATPGLARTERSREVEPRPQAGEADELAAGVAALGLLARTTSLDGVVSGAEIVTSPVLHGAGRAGAPADGSRTGPLPAAALEKGRVLVRLLTEQLSRAQAALADDALVLAQTAMPAELEAEPIPDSESETLRRAKLLETARRLEAFGRSVRDLVTELGAERGREILGTTPEKAGWESQVATFVRAYRDALMAARQRLLVPVTTPAPGRGPWAPSEDWDRGAATNLLAAAQQFEVTVEGLGLTDTSLLQAGPEVGCSVFRALVEERFESLGLDPSSGAAETGGGGLARHLGLDLTTAEEGLRDLLRYEAWNQAAPFCEGDDTARLGRAVAAMLLRVRDLRVAELQVGIARVESYARRPWEVPEFVEGAVVRMLGAYDLPERLGLNRYPEPTFAVTPRTPSEEVQEVRRDLADLGTLLDGAWRRLATLSQDESSGYPAELRRRRMKTLPEAGPWARLLARYADVPALAALRTPLSQLAVAEARLLEVESADPSFATRVGRSAAGFVRRVLNAATLLDPPPSGAVALAGPRAGDPGVTTTLTGTVLTRVLGALGADASLPWWTGAGVAQELHRASQQAWGTAAHPTRIAAHAATAYQEARRRVLSMGTRRVAPPDADLLLPGEVQVTRLFGGLTLNRETRYVLVELGGRLDFPNVRTADGRTAFLELQRLRLASTGQIVLAAAARSPLPFAEASFLGEFHARGDLPRRSMALSGRGVLTFLTPPHNPDSGLPFPTEIEASASYEPAAYGADGQPLGWRFTFQAGGTFRRSFGPDFAVFGAGAGLVAGRSPEGNPVGGVTVGGSVGLFRKADRRAVEPPEPSDFHVVVERAGVEIVGTVGEGGYAAVTNGTVKLPDLFYPTDLPAELACDAPGARRVGPSVSIQSPIRVRYAAGGRPQLEGTLRFSHFGVRLGGTGAATGSNAGYAALTVCQADLGLDAEGLPYLEVPRAGLGFQIPSWDRGLLRVQNLRLGLAGRIQGEVLLVEDFDLVRAGGLEIALLGAPALADPAVRPPAACRGTRLVLEDVPGFPQPRVLLVGGVRAQFPVEFISQLDGSHAGGFFCGGIRIDPTEDGPVLSAFVEEFGLSGDFKVQQGKFSLKNARLGAANFEGILNPDPERPFQISISGDLQVGAFVFGMSDARILYRGLDVPPAFGLGALRFARDAATPLPAPFNLMPATVEFAELAFKRSSAPLIEMLAPENLRITASVRIGLPTLAKAFVGGGVSGVVFEFREDGTPIPPAIDGFDLTMSSSAELKLPAFGDLSGKLRFGGLRRALADPEHPRPDQIYAVGQMTGTQNGVKLGLLGAFTLVGPIGFCLDVNLGGAGITLAPTPFQITGASGGLALLQTDNPCDFTEYFEFDTATGTYRLKQTVELPPVGMPWTAFVESLEAAAERVAEFAEQFPHPGAAAMDAASDRTASSNASTDASPAGGEPELLATEGDARARMAESAFPPGTFAAFGCPEECPPKTVAILCQPHPDVARFPGRVIFKFSSIPEDVLTNAPPRGLGLDPAAVRGLASDRARLGGAVADRLVTHLRSRVPAAPSLPPSVRSFLAEQERLALEGVRVLASNGVSLAASRGPDAYAAVRDELYRGMGCPDLSVSVAGRMSMVGLSAFGWVEGRETSSFSGSGGVVGEVNALGIPLGEARVFVSTTDASGLPNPSACGQVTASLGPLDFGRVDLAMRCENCVVELLRLFPAVVRAVGPAFLQEAARQVAPGWEVEAADPEAFLARWQREPVESRQGMALGLLAQLAMAGPEALPGNLAERLREAFTAAWDRIRPQLVLCGEVTPRFLGLPLTLGGRGVGLNFLGEKTGMLGEMGFAPSSFVPVFPPGDEASLSFAYRTTDTVTFLLRSLDGTLARPDTREAFVREQVDLFLENLVVAARYQWHPFGLELGDAAVRFLMPDLLDHPAMPGSDWRNPDELGEPAVPTRDEVLVQAAASGKLGLAFEWLGTAADFEQIFPAGDPRREAARGRGWDLRRTYFPHGGLVGGARMALPRLLMVAPSEWQPLYDEAVHGEDLFAQASAGLRFIQEFVLRTETNGTAAFYTPAPNPPMLFDAGGRPLSAAEARARVVRAPDDFSPAGLVRQLRGLDLGAPSSVAHLYPDHLAFLRAEMTNLTLFGMPVFGTARMTGRPSPLRIVDGAPLARLEVDIDGASPLGKVAGGGFRFGFDLYSTPEQNLAAWARPLAEALQRGTVGTAAQSGVGRARNPAAGGDSAAAVLSRLAAEMPRQLPRFAATNVLPALNVVTLRDWASGGAPAVLGVEEGAVGGSGVTGGLGGRGRGSLPRAASPVLRAELSLYAFSPFYDPLAVGDGPVGNARRLGGFAAQGRVEVLPDVPGRAGSGEAEFSVTATGTGPRLAGRLRALNLPTPFPGITFANAQAEFDSQGAPFLRAATSVPDLGLGEWFRLRPVPPRTTLGANFTMHQASAAPSSTAGGALAGLGDFLQTLPVSAELELPPCRLTSDLLAGELVMHGTGGLTQPVVLRESSWSARASVLAGAGAPGLHSTAAVASGSSPSSITFRAPLGGVNRDLMRVSGLPASAFRVDGGRAGAFVARWDATASGALTVELFPGNTVAGLTSRSLQVAPVAGGQLEFQFASDGTFLLEGELAAPFGGAAAGAFAAGARVRVTQEGATLSGAVGASTGTLEVGWVEGRLATRFSGGLTLPPLVALGGRVTLSGPEGGPMTVTVDAAGTCVSGARLTLQGFAEGAPVTLNVPRFCLGAGRTFTGITPSAGSNPGRHAVPRTDLSVGAFILENLRSLSLSGAFDAGVVRLDFDADLALRSLFRIPVRGSVGSDGIQFVQNASTARLIGMEFTQVRLGATNRLGDLPDIGFVGRLPGLPAAWAGVDLAGRIPGNGAFSLLPANALDAFDLVPAFPLSGAWPRFQYRPEAYETVVRPSAPAAYWPLGETEGPVLDQRLKQFSGVTGLQRRSGTVVGNVTRGETGAFEAASNRGVRLRGSSGYVRFDHEALAPSGGGFSVSLWFRRTASPLRATPATLVARGAQWSLAFRERVPGDGNRLQFGLAGLTAPGGGSLDWLYGRTRLDDTDWHQVVAVYDGGAQFLYLDGRLEAWQPVEGGVTPMAGVATTLGTRLQGSITDNDFNGWVDEVAVFRGALGPVEVLAQWLAAGKGGLALEAQLVADAVPGLPARGVTGLLHPNGDLIASVEPGGTSAFTGLSLPAFRATLVKLGTESAAAFEADLAVPGLDDAPLARVRGVMSGSGAFAARASAFAERGVFGWNLRLTELATTGDWRLRRATSRVRGQLALPHGIATMEVGGDLDAAGGTYRLRGSAGGELRLGGTLPFRFSVAPEVSHERFVLPGELALGEASDAATFTTRLDVTKEGRVAASFTGLTDWVSFTGVGHGRLDWAGTLDYDSSGLPRVRFRGQLGLATPQHPESIDDLPVGLGVGVSLKPRVTLSLRNPDRPVAVNVRGVATVEPDQPFQGRSSFVFPLR